MGVPSLRTLAISAGKKTSRWGSPLSVAESFSPNASLRISGATRGRAAIFDGADGLPPSAAQVWAHHCRSELPEKPVDISKTLPCSLANLSTAWCRRPGAVSWNVA